jgi:hypothetical protein
MRFLVSYRFVCKNWFYASYYRQLKGEENGEENGVAISPAKH